jgi:hypothetical protein
MHACKILLSTRVLRAESITLWPHQSEGEAGAHHPPVQGVGELCFGDSSLPLFEMSYYIRICHRLSIQTDSSFLHRQINPPWPVLL